MYIWDNLFDTILHYIAANKVLYNKIFIINHINVVTKTHRTFLENNIVRLAKLYICIVLANIRNTWTIYVKYSLCGPIHFKYYPCFTYLVEEEHN